MFSNQGNVDGGKVGNCKGRKSPRLIQRYNFLTLYGQLKHFFKKPQEHCAQRKIILEKCGRIWTFILLDPMELSFFLNEVFWGFQGPDFISGATCFPVGHNLEASNDRNLFPVEFCLGAELWFGWALPEAAGFSRVSEAWRHSADALPDRSPFSAQVSVSIKHLEFSQICLEWANISKSLKVRSIRIVLMPVSLGNDPAWHAREWGAEPVLVGWQKLHSHDLWCRLCKAGEEILTPLAASVQELIKSWSSSPLTYSTGNQARRTVGVFSVQPSLTTDFFLISTVMSSYYCSSISAVSFFIRISFF